MSMTILPVRGSAPPADALTTTWLQAASLVDAINDSYLSWLAAIMAKRRELEAQRRHAMRFV